MKRSLTKSEILRKKQDIDRIFKQGKYFSCKGMRLIAIENDIHFDRAIVIPAKKYGNSVQRNKIRRQVKEIWRNYQNRIMSSASPSLAKGHDIAIIVYPGRVFDFSSLESELTNLLDKINQK